jgi:putative oxidoreductase
MHLRKIHNPFSRFSEEVYSALRMVAGFLFTCHGAQKIMGLWPDPYMMYPVGSQIWFGGILELVLGLLIMIGFFTPFAALLASGEMAVAYFQFHCRYMFNGDFFPIANHGELAVIYCFLFLFIATKGGGEWSLDNSHRGGNRK